MPDTYSEPEVLDRREGPHGEAVLRRRDDRFEIIANGCFLMDTSDGRSERALVTAALDAYGGPDAAPAPHLLIGGLGVGFSLAQAAADPRPRTVTVVEREQAVIDWHTAGEAPLAPFAGSGHTDPRVRLVHADLLDHLAGAEAAYDVLCLDVDNGPDWTVTDSNDGLYSDLGLTMLRRALTPHGVLAVWSAAPSAAFERRLAGHFGPVRSIELAVGLERALPDVVHLARTR